MKEGNKPITNMEKLMGKLRGQEPVWILLPSGVAGQLPIGLMGELARSELILGATKEETEKLRKALSGESNV